MIRSDRVAAPHLGGGACPPLRLTGYIRTATGDPPGDLERQASAIRKAARDQRWDIGQIVAEMASGADLDRSGLAATLSRVRRGECNGLIVARLDRLICSLAQFRRLFDDACLSGWVLVVLDAGIDLSTPAGWHRAEELVKASDYERRLTSMRTTEALAAKKAAGLRIGRPRTCPDGVLERVVGMRVRGDRLADIASELNNDDIPTPGGGGRWHNSHVSRLLKTRDAMQLLQDSSIASPAARAWRDDFEHKRGTGLLPPDHPSQP
jgi:DNA invertase Pin-like site-specific DNA recombinase